jgi:hypothetical protein
MSSNEGFHWDERLDCVSRRSSCELFFPGDLGPLLLEWRFSLPFRNRLEGKEKKKEKKKKNEKKKKKKKKKKKEKKKRKERENHYVDSQKELFQPLAGVKHVSIIQINSPVASKIWNIF